MQMPIIAIENLMEEFGMKTRKHGLVEREMELVRILMAYCKTQKIFSGEIEKIFSCAIDYML